MNLLLKHKFWEAGQRESKIQVDLERVARDYVINILNLAFRFGNRANGMIDHNLNLRKAYSSSFLCKCMRKGNINYNDLISTLYFSYDMNLSTQIIDF